MWQPESIIRAWCDPEIRANLSPAERATLPPHPAGVLELPAALAASTLGSGTGVFTSDPAVCQTPGDACYLTLTDSCRTSLSTPGCLTKCIPGGDCGGPAGSKPPSDGGSNPPQLTYQAATCTWFDCTLTIWGC